MLFPAQTRWRRRLAFCLAVALVGCGLEVRNHTYAAEGPAEGEGPSLYVAATREHSGVIKESLTHGAPYRVSVTLDAPAEQSKPFRVRTVKFEHEGKIHVAHEANTEPLVASPSDGAPSPKKRMAVWVALDDLTFVDGSTVTVEAETQLAGSTDWVTTKRTFRAAKEEKSYGFCQRLAMH